jgi:hypothetical protein
MKLLINGVETWVKACIMYNDASCTVPCGITLIMKVRCARGKIPDLYKQLITSFKLRFRGVMDSDEPKRGMIEFRVLQCETELDAIDYLRGRGFGIIQKRAF